MSSVNALKEIHKALTQASMACPYIHKALTQASMTCPYPFFIHHRTPDTKGVAVFMQAFLCQYQTVKTHSTSNKSCVD